MDISCLCTNINKLVEIVHKIVNKRLFSRKNEGACYKLAKICFYVFLFLYLVKD